MGVDITILTLLWRGCRGPGRAAGPVRGGGGEGGRGGGAGALPGRYPLPPGVPGRVGASPLSPLGTAGHQFITMISYVYVVTARSAVTLGPCTARLTVCNILTGRFLAALHTAKSGSALCYRISPSKFAFVAGPDQVLCGGLV